MNRNRVARGVLTALLLACTIPGAVAQQVETDTSRTNKPPGEQSRWLPPLHFLERSYVFGGLPLHDLGLEGQIAPHIVLIDQLTPRPYDAGEMARHGGTGWSLTITPLVRARILTTYSAPVRIPSFLPRVNLQRFSIRKPDGDWSGKRVAMTGMRLTVGHHSNGQDGCVLTGLEDPDVTCREPTDADVRTLRPNTTNGSFSTNYIQLGVQRKWMAVDDWNVASRATWAGLTFEANPSWLKIGGVLDEALRPAYGPNRLRLDLGREGPGWRGGLLRTTGSVEYLFKESGLGSSNVRVTASAELTNRRLGSGLFVRYIYGQDYYNIHFMENLHRAELGFVFDQSRLQEFVRASRQTIGGRPQT